MGVSSTAGRFAAGVHFDGVDTDEARRLLELRYKLSTLVADEYASAGFPKVVQDNIYGVRRRRRSRPG